MPEFSFKSLSSRELGALVSQALKELVKRAIKGDHIAEQFSKRYFYLVGWWAGGPKAKSTRNGRFVPNSEVIGFLS